MKTTTTGKDITQRINRTISSKEQLRSSKSATAVLANTIADVAEAKEWKTCNPWRLQYAFDEDRISVPVNIAYDDFLCRNIKKLINLSEWCLNNEVLESIGRDGKQLVTAVKLNHCKGITVDGIKHLRGMTYLYVLSLRGVLTISAEVAKVIGSLKHLIKLDVSENTIESAALTIMGQTCSQLTTLYLQKCRGLDNSMMAILLQFVQRFRKLEKLDFAESGGFTDDGCLFMLTAAPSVTASLSFDGCKQLSSLAFTTFRQRFARLEYLNLSNTSVGNSVFEWISEGCLALKTINFHNCKGFDDNGLMLIGRRCTLLEDLYITNCDLISDAGFIGFYKYFLGTGLKRIDISGCIHCGAVTCQLLSLHADQLVEVKFNGLSNIAGEWLNQLLINAVNLEVFEMFVEIKIAVTHRLSTIPHISDETIASMRCSKLRDFKISGAFLVSDVGLKLLVLKCPQLVSLDIAQCGSVTDGFLRALSQADLKDTTAKSLTYLNLSGCNKVTDIGLQCLSTSCPNLKSLLLSGCTSITDNGISAITRGLKALEVLNIRNCDYVTELSLTPLIKSLSNLKSLDITSLDLVTVEIVKNVAIYAPQITVLNCELCDMAVREYHDVLKGLYVPAVGEGEVFRPSRYKLPFATPVINYRKLEPRCKSVIEYNRYVMEMRKKDKAIRVIQKLVLWMYRVGSARRGKEKTLKVLQWQEFNRQETLRETRKLFKTQSKINRQHAAISLQRFFKKLMAVRFAKRKLNNIRLRRNSCILIQKCYRSHMARKRTKRLFRILYQHYSRFGHIAHKLLVIHAARTLHRQIIKVQNWIRMCKNRKRFLTAKRGVVLFQKRIRRRFKYSIITRKVLWGIVTTIERRQAAVTILQRNFKAALFNKNMSKFILVCGIYHRTEVDMHNWYAGIIQRYWRGFVGRKKAYRIRMAPFWTEMMLAKLQAHIRRRQVQRWFKGFKKVKKRIMRRWRQLLWCGKPPLRLGHYAKRIQRRYRRFAMVHRRGWSAKAIQRAYRGYATRKWWLSMIYQLKILYILRIQRSARRFIGKMRRRLLLARNHMAAYKVQRWMRLGFFSSREMKKRLAGAKAAILRKNHLAEKKQIVLKRQLRSVERCKLLLLGWYALRIQRKYRKWKAIRDRRLAAADYRSQAVKDTQNDILDERLAGFFTNFKPWKVLSQTVSQIKDRIVAQSGDIDPDDVNRMRQAILKSQTKSILQEGVVEIHVTVGAKEMAHFARDQEKFKTAGEPHFEMIPEDVSGSLMALQMHLWYMKGTGRDCICELEIENIPPGMSNAKLRDRIAKQRVQGTKIAWNPSVHIEFRGQCTIQQGKGGFAIGEILVSHDERDALRLEDAGYKMARKLLKFGFNSSVWVKQREVIDDGEMYKNLGLLNVRPWSSKYLLDTAKKFNLSEKDVMSFRDTWDTIMKGQYRQSASLELILNYLDYPLTDIAKWVCSAINPARPNELKFDEYVHMVCFYVMLQRLDLMRFLFGHADEARKGFLKKEQFDKFMQILAEGSGYSTVIWISQFEDFWNPKLQSFFFEGFDEFAKVNPVSLWQAQNLQRQFMRFNLGEGYWYKKSNDFRLVRKDMGIRLM